MADALLSREDAKPVRGTARQRPPHVSPLSQGTGEDLAAGRCVRRRRQRSMDGMTTPGTTRQEFIPTEPVVMVRGLTKSYGGLVVVDDLDLEVHAGEVLGLIGANGAGKTTTVEILQGLRRSDAGQVRVLGLDPIKDADRLRPQIGSQLQSSGLPDRLRVSEAVDLFAGPRAQDGEALLEQFGLAHRLRRPFAGMSGGEQQRLFLVLALLNQPRLVILDELTQGLDPAARREVWSAVAKLRDAGTTVLLVTHELDEAEALCERVVALRGGRVLDQGTPAQLVARHAGEVTVRFGHPATEPVDVTAAALQDLNRLPGVQAVIHERGQIAVRGEREVIAQVGAWLVRRGTPVPADLRVDIPNLETALLTLLDQPATTNTPMRIAS
jgi:ABC-2 type transport system ATP-binding protein